MADRRRGLFLEAVERVNVRLITLCGEPCYPDIDADGGG
ncbi:hypothetical protein GPAL_1259 [Glaciecola pallidula DSM 14239 = ACAM 615]|uniref:Uncharacterized protein n=1 Tax=Brumicola pallidula DSM 14239 = ACAM 615 TaxID=1121922 RepID=K6ZCQ2_9ALTE|nr:hypothetical protein GPAL_1259 [Glaciecola pallidula DSM 14239 = ACAM 615]